MTEELRCYTFTLYQLSSIQQGIQAGHAAVELGMKAYKKQMRMRSGTDFGVYHEWATEWKTMVLLNGGDLSELEEFRDFLSFDGNTFPWAAFHESDESLGSLLTSVAIILPARIFLTAEAARKKIPLEPEEVPFCELWEIELIDRLSKAGLAR
jgi:hypothetical protein